LRRVLALLRFYQIDEVAISQGHDFGGALAQEFQKGRFVCTN
jgi:hypothetical protein